MAMTKKEQAEVAELKQRLAEALAWRRTDAVEKDVEPPKSGRGDFNRLTKGWNFNEYTTRVYKACSSSIHHGEGWEATSTQCPLSLYSTEVLAWKALRHRLENKYSAELARIDAKIEELQSQPA